MSSSDIVHEARCSVEMLPDFMTINDRRLLCVRRRPRAGAARQRIMIVPPFAEEMNKCRRLLALSAEALAAAGAEVWLPDLSGTGDSEGEFAHASWSRWCDELVSLDAALAASQANVPHAYLAVRSGALLLADASTRLANLHRATILLWQPVFDGARFLQQFLRLRTMAGRLSGVDESVSGLMARVRAGEIVEVAGYGLGASVADGLDAARLAPAGFAMARRLTLLEFKNTLGATPSLPAAQFVAACGEDHCEARVQTLECEQFWATQEISAPRVVVDASLSALCAP